MTQGLPQDWNPDAARHWQAGDRNAAIQAVLGAINQAQGPKPPPLVLQLTYYLFLIRDYPAAARFIEAGLRDSPDHPELLRNLAVCRSRAGQAEAAVEAARRSLDRSPDDFSVWDVLAASLFRLGDLDGAAQAGTRALVLKDQAAGPPPADWTAPDPDQRWPEAVDGKVNAIAFSLWGNDPRYLRGALDNALAARVYYPGWQMRVHVDNTVQPDLLEALRDLGVVVVMEPRNQTQAQKLSWRFGVANDPGVHRFVVRDIDSVLTAREADAVALWIGSGLPFHVMRDWWTHTDLMLAGMWGGVAGVLPPLAPLLADYRPPHLETPNIDQWFLRDRVWPFLRGRVLVHDRCFQAPGSRPFPGSVPDGSRHVGQCEFTARPDRQAARLAAWLDGMPCLAVH